MQSPDPFQSSPHRRVQDPGRRPEVALYLAHAKRNTPSRCTVGRCDAFP
jgi:hypothetical protein